MDISSKTRAEIGIFGGSGLYSLLEDAEEVALDTPYGAPSARISLGKIGDVDIAFLPRHGIRHEYPPHMIPYRANIWALHRLGVKRILGPCAAGSLQASVKPGHFVICDQFVNFTRDRKDTFYDGPITTHISTADPYCSELRSIAIDRAKRIGLEIHERGTVVVIQGPRFSTRSESRMFNRNGWEVINMTQYPEVVLARELEICYVNISLITDYDAGLEGDPSIRPVIQEEVARVFKENIQNVKRLLTEVVKKIPKERSCECSEALKYARIEG